MHCWARYLFVAVVIVLGTLSMLGACGHQGPLYMPAPAAESAPPAKAGSDVPQVPAAGGEPAVNAPGAAADEGLLSWPAGRAGRCTLGCPEPVGSAP